MTDDAVRGFLEADREARLRRACSSLWYLSKICIREPFVTHGFQLTSDFHLPMMDEMDRKTKLRLAGKYVRYDGNIWSRYYYKTTVVCVRAIQRFLIDPGTTMIWWHAVEEKAQDAVQWIGRQFMENDELRALRPEIMPSKRERKWCTASGFRFKGNKAQAPSLRAYGAGSEATGGHAQVGVLDDPIGFNDIEDNLMPFKRRWFGRTVMNVIMTPPELWLQATRWDGDDIYADWLKHPDWDIRVRACYETDGVPDWNGEAVLYPRDWIEQKRRSMSSYEFSTQMMNDPLPDEARIWQSDVCEHHCDTKEAMKGTGRFFVLSDPAPKGSGSLTGIGEKARGDGSGDYWSISVVRLRVLGERLQAILVDGEHSRDWSVDEGLTYAANFMHKYQTNLFFNEYYGGAGMDLTDEMLRVCDRMGRRRPHLEPGTGGRYLLPRFVDSHASGAKNLRFERLADWARRADFLICDSVPERFLHGNGENVGFLPQVRNWRPLPKGRNSLKWDDDADSVSRCTDPSLLRFAPKREFVSGSVFAPVEEAEETFGSRHVRW